MQNSTANNTNNLVIEDFNHGSVTQAIQTRLKLAQLRFEKCELREAQQVFEEALELARKKGDARLVMEALAGLIRMAQEALNRERVRELEAELNVWMDRNNNELPPTVWHCKAAVCYFNQNYLQAQKYELKYLREVRRQSLDEDVTKAWIMLANILAYRGMFRRAKMIASHLVEQTQNNTFKGFFSLILGFCAENSGDFEKVEYYYDQAHSHFLKEHNWYNYLYVLLGYARLARIRQDFNRSRWYLNLVDQAATTAQFGALRRAIGRERKKLEEESVDLVIDCTKGLVKTRECQTISLKKQFVLLHILEALSEAHQRGGQENKGLSKAEIIERVWKEVYRPEFHDNKLYYNINRIRKLIEPSMKQPQYLLNWKEGYRFAPGLRVQIIHDQNMKDGE